MEENGKRGQEKVTSGSQQWLALEEDGTWLRVHRSIVSGRCCVCVGLCACVRMCVPVCVCVWCVSACACALATHCGCAHASETGICGPLIRRFAHTYPAPKLFFPPLAEEEAEVREEIAEINMGGDDEGDGDMGTPLLLPRYVALSVSIFGFGGFFYRFSRLLRRFS